MPNRSLAALPADRMDDDKLEAISGMRLLSVMNTLFSIMSDTTEPGKTVEDNNVLKFAETGTTIDGETREFWILKAAGMKVVIFTGSEKVIRMAAVFIFSEKLRMYGAMLSAVNWPTCLADANGMAVTDCPCWFCKRPLAIEA